MSRPNRPEAIECLQSIIDVYEISGDEVLLDEDDIQAIKLAIDSLKTDEAYNLLYEKADVRENIHGEWIKIQSGDEDFPESIVCSKCKNANSHLDFNEHGEPIGKVFVTSKFCPNCGAYMRGKT